MTTAEHTVHNGKTLRAILDDHALWLRSGGTGGKRADLARSNFARVDLAGVNLAGAFLARSSFAGANCAGVNFAGAFLARSSFAGANCAGVNFAGAELAGADLASANCAGVNFAGAFLADARGNMREVKSAQFDKWAITWTTAPDGIVTLQIGCENHPLEMWEKSDPRWIAAMDESATGWWAKYRDLVLALVNASPAVPYGKPRT